MIKVIIVEDDPMVAEIDKRYTQDILELEVVGVYNNGKDALEALKSSKIDLVILDVYMPKLSGIEVLRQMRALGIKTDVIMVTAAYETNTLEEALSLGITDYLIKPFEYDRFIQALNKFKKKYDFIKVNSKFNQNNVDSLIHGNFIKNDKGLKKGLNENTLQKVRNFIKENSEKSYTSEEIADKVGLSRVTIRRYMNYMKDEGEIISEIDYETGGRPSIKYKISM